MAYIGSTRVATAMWPVMMQTILISNVQEKIMCRKLAGLLGGWWQHQSRMEMSCRAYRLTTKVSCPQKVDLHLNQPLPDDWCRLIFQNHIMPALFDHDIGGNREGVLGACPSWNWCRTSNGQAPSTPSLSLLPPKSWSNKAGIIWFWDIRRHQPSGRGWFWSTFWGLLTFVVSRYARHDFSTIALSHVIFRSGWTSRAHLMYPQ